MEWFKKVKKGFSDYWLIGIIVLLLVICLAMLGFYYSNVSRHFSTDSDEWGNFGGYLGSITGLLAFAGVLYTIQQSSKAHTEDSQRNLFFKLLDLYQRQVDSVEYVNQLQDKYCKRIDAFKEFSALSIAYTNIYISLKQITSSSNGEIEKNKKVKSVYEIIMRNCLSSLPKESSAFIALKELLEEKISHYDLNLFVLSYNICRSYFLEVKTDAKIKDICDAMKYVSDLLYEKYGFMLGQYYRTVFYILETVSKVSDSSLRKSLSKTFRSQLSRYELILLLYNALSSQSKPEVIKLYRENDLFNNLNYDDLPTIGNATYNTRKEKEEAKKEYIEELFTCFEKNYKE